MKAIFDDAVDWAMGTLDAARRAEVERKIARDPVLRAIVQDIEAKLAPLAMLLPPETPPADLLDRIDAAIDGQPAAPAGTTTVRGADLSWLTVAPGVSIAMLRIDRRRRRSSFLLRLDPGAELPAHEHPGVEEAFVIEGELHFGDHVVRAGDYHCAAAGRHPVGRSPGGCTAFLTRAE